ncbi:MAG: hypothetical protein ACOX4P_06260 [Anaerovoracaceae bacterium]
MNGNQGITIFITAFIYLILLSGLVFLFYENLRSVYQQLRILRRLEARKQEHRIEGDIEKWLRQALLTTIVKPISPKMFIFGLGCLFIIVFLISINTLSIVSSIIVSFITVSLPCFLIAIHFVEVRRKGSREGEALIVEFLRQYRMTGYNIFETIEQVIASKLDIKITRRLLYKLLLDLRDTGSSRNIKKATEKFAYSLHTNWSRMLAHNIYIAAVKGTNVSLAIEDILIQLREARALSEERKRLNSEATRMTYYMVPFIYGATVIMAINYLDLPFTKFLYNQFYTPEGLVLFLLIVFLFLGNIGIISLATNQRFDY